MKQGCLPHLIGMSPPSRDVPPTDHWDVPLVNWDVPHDLRGMFLVPRDVPSLKGQGCPHTDQRLRDVPIIHWGYPCPISHWDIPIHHGEVPHFNQDVPLMEGTSPTSRDVPSTHHWDVPLIERDIPVPYLTEISPFIVERSPISIRMSP